MVEAFAGLLQGGSALRSSSPHTHVGGAAGSLHTAGSGSAAATPPHFSHTAPGGFPAMPLAFVGGAAGSGSAAAIPLPRFDTPYAGLPVTPMLPLAADSAPMGFTANPTRLQPEAPGPSAALHLSPGPLAADPHAMPRQLPEAVEPAKVEPVTVGPVTAGPVTAGIAAGTVAPLVVASVAAGTSSSILMGDTTSILGADDIPGVVDEEERSFWEGLVQEYDGKVTAAAPATFAGAGLNPALSGKRALWQQQQQQALAVSLHIGATEASMTAPAAAASDTTVASTAPDDPGTGAAISPLQSPVELRRRRSSVRGLMLAPPAVPEQQRPAGSPPEGGAYP